MNPDKEFDEALKQLGNLYEEGKSCVHYFYPDLSVESEHKASRLFDVLREMRDLAAITMKKLYQSNEHKN